MEPGFRPKDRVVLGFLVRWTQEAALRPQEPWVGQGEAAAEAP